MIDRISIDVTALTEKGDLTTEQRERLVNVLTELQALLGASGSGVNTTAADAFTDLMYTVAAGIPPASIHRED